VHERPSHGCQMYVMEIRVSVQSTRKVELEGWQRGEAISKRSDATRRDHQGTWSRRGMTLDLMSTSTPGCLFIRKYRSSTLTSRVIFAVVTSVTGPRSRDVMVCRGAAFHRFRIFRQVSCCLLFQQIFCGKVAHHQSNRTIKTARSLFG